MKLEPHRAWHTYYSKVRLIFGITSHIKCNPSASSTPAHNDPFRMLAAWKYFLPPLRPTYPPLAARPILLAFRTYRKPSNPRRNGIHNHSTMNDINSYLSNTFNWLRIPVLASSGLAVVLSGLLYFKQK